MCGVAGRFHPERVPDLPGWSEQAAALLAHRGPDGAGRYRDGRCELVHRRLAVIDLTATGRQPMANEDDSIWVVYNGEIYNHRTLRAELTGKGHTFRGTSDTEVLVHLYEELGDGLVERLRGIFAFAIYDARRRRLLLVRDRFGVKPLFWSAFPGQWVFASEMKAITAVPAFTPTIDRQACYDFLSLGYVPEPATGFAEIQAVPAGTMLAVDAEGARATRYYKSEARAEPGQSRRETVERCAARLLESVGRQSVADVPVAALLSGGIDSSLVVAAHRQATGNSTATFSMRFPDARHDETDAARTVAAHCGTEHHVIDVAEPGVTPESILALLRHFDQPFADTSFLPTYWVASAVRDRGIICTLSGDGGDEAFGGYPRFWRANRLTQLMSLPDWVRRTLVVTGRSMTESTRDWGRQMAKAATLADEGREDTAPLIGGLSAYLTESQKADLVAAPARDGLLPSWRHFNGYEPRGGRDLEELSRRMTETLFAVSLPSDMLRKVDMMSMRASIELRVPMLDEGVVSVGMSLPHHLKTDGRRGKLVLRDLARHWLPDTVARRPKHGFSIPLDVMVPPSLHQVAEELLCGDDARTAGVVNRRLVRRWLRAFAAAGTGTIPHGGAISREGLHRRVIMLLSLELWMRDHCLTW
jgi:asparagine synthase (glutamine-hydrolysing)